MPTSCRLLLHHHQLLLLLLLVLIFHRDFVNPASAATSQLPSSEKEALKSIASALNKTDWDFDTDPCSGESGWIDPIQESSNSVNCNCSIVNVTGCHIVNITLKTQNLAGTLPKDLGGLPYLQVIDLAKNYLSGSIPPQWGSTKLIKISLLGNRLNGSIPKEIGNITTLKELVLEHNQLSGVLPPELGNLGNLQNLFLTANNLSGLLPETLGKLTNLQDFRIGGNPFTGQIPGFLQNLTNLYSLLIQGNNLSGPIPPGIGALWKMKDLRISDLVGGKESTFPPLGNLTNLHILILRDCNLVGPLPDFWANLSNLQLLLDLSFNKLTGEFPPSFISSSLLQYMYLTSNKLSGPVPDYMLQIQKSFDLSYNNFSSPSECQSGHVNLFASSSMNNTSKIVSCLASNKCPSKKYYTMNINCGGPKTTIEKITYDEDLDVGSPSRFYQSSSNWVFSNTGNFIDDNNPVDTYIQANTTALSPNASSLYLNARISPISLTYYGYCLINGNYTVHLHFAEIKFTGDKTYASLGRRVFNVYVQGNLVLKDFNIEDEAGGVGIPVVKNFTATVVSNTLEIRFYWAGKGTNAIPSKGTFGPLISAISISPGFPVPSEGSSISTLAKVGIALAALVAISLILGIIWWVCCRRKEAFEGNFTLRQLKAATDNFNPANKIGEGGFGPVYKGILADGTTMAVKQLSSVSMQGDREFINEVGMISALHHPHLVKLYGCCIEGNQLLLVYEYMENNSLARALYGPEEHLLNLDWPTRLKICIGIARGLAYLHEESMLKIVHRDIKATNVLLDKHLNPKISDFGLAKLNEDDTTHVSTRIAGTYGYMAPEYAMRGQLSSKADVYSFGVVVLEVVSGKNNSTFRPDEEDCYYLLDWALVLKQRGKLLDLIDRRMGLEYNQDEVMTAIDVALLCTNMSPAVRPSMSSVVSMLAGSVPVISVEQVAQKLLPPRDDVAVDVSDGPLTSSSISNDDLYTPRCVSTDSYEKSSLFTSLPSDSKI